MNSSILKTERLFLCAVGELEPNAYGVTVRDWMEQSRHTPFSIGTVYVVAERMHELGYITASEGERTPERGNRPKCYWQLTESGRREAVLTEEMNTWLLSPSWAGAV